MGWSEVKSRQLKVLSAVAGGAAVVAMGALTVTFSDISVAEPPEPAPPGPVTTSEVTTGETIVETVAPEAPETSAAVPPITTTPSAFPPTAEQP
jgi:hypothetical protein